MHLHDEHKIKDQIIYIPYTGMTPKLRHIEFETLSIYLKITLRKIKISEN